MVGEAPSPRLFGSTRLPICRRAGSRGVGSGCGGGSLDAFWPPEPAKKIERCQVILITLNVSGWRRGWGGGMCGECVEGEVGGQGSHTGMCSLGL